MWKSRSGSCIRPNWQETCFPHRWHRRIVAVSCRDGTGDSAHKFDVSEELITLSVPHSLSLPVVFARICHRFVVKASLGFSACFSWRPGVWRTL